MFSDTSNHMKDDPSTFDMEIILLIRDEFWYLYKCEA